MSVVNDSGVYLPPSPPEKKSFWHRSNASITSSSNHRSCLNENEPFSISRESFDSYRRSFDISARSPVILPDTPPRHSLESWSARAPRSLRSDPRSDLTSPTQEETFEEVKLADDPKPQKKRGIFGRFGDSSEAASGGSGGGHLGFHNLTGRKRGHSGQGAELGKMDRPGTAGSLKAVVGPTES
ncbi:MAG: hypothetical protein M1814_003120 [Vezdaea aestivalis]|nr:MAG: hypothetical protein M1814_003120 [Vezdaea aestivalis]